MTIPATAALAIIGAGPAGLAAAVHAARIGIDHVLIDQAAPGGLLRAAFLVENMPGFPAALPGTELSDLLAEQAERHGVRRITLGVDAVRKEGDGYDVLSAGTPIWARVCIIATGTQPVMPVVSGWDHALSLGRLHTDARTLPGDLRRTSVVVSGGGDIAFDTALTAHHRGARVEILMRGRNPRAHRALCRRISGLGIPVRPEWAIDGIAAGSNGLDLACRNGDGRVETLSAAHLLCCHGRVPDDRLWRTAAGAGVPLPPDAGIGADGLFCAGDILGRGCRFVAVACGDGVIACHRAIEWVTSPHPQGAHHA